MQDIKTKRPVLTTINIRKAVRDRLHDFVFNQNPRPVIADVVSIAVEKWLDGEQEKTK